MVEINPKNGEITFLEEYKNRLEIKVAVMIPHDSVFSMEVSSKSGALMTRLIVCS